MSAMKRVYRAIDSAAAQGRLLERAHREVCRELDVLIPWASPWIVRSLQRLYRKAFTAARRKVPKVG